MEWLKNAIGEDLYNELKTNGMIEKLKKSFGETPYIPHDKDKWIEKHVFNNQRAEIKGYKDKIKEYETELANRKDLITSEEHKAELLKKENSFKERIADIEKSSNKEIETLKKNNAFMNVLVSSGCIDPEMGLKAIDMEEILIKDGKVLNNQDLIDGLKRGKPYLFKVNNDTGVPPRGNGDNKNTKEQLIEQYNKMAPGAAKMALDRQIRSLENNK
jgi:hypothetical protein